MQSQGFIFIDFLTSCPGAANYHALPVLNYLIPGCARLQTQKAQSWVLVLCLRVPLGLWVQRSHFISSPKTSLIWKSSFVSVKNSIAETSVRDFALAVLSDKLFNEC